MNLGWQLAGSRAGWIYGCPGLDCPDFCFYILFERNYVIRERRGNEDPQFMDKIKDYILGGELKAAMLIVAVWILPRPYD